LSTVCGYYRFAPIDGRIASNPAQYVRRPKVHPTDARGLDRPILLRHDGTRLDRRTAAIRPRPSRVATTRATRPRHLATTTTPMVVPTAMVVRSQ